MIALRRVVADDFPLVARWLAEPHVHRWWHHDLGLAAVERDFGPGVRGEEAGEDLLALEDGRPLGLVQRCRWQDCPEERDALARHVALPDEALTIDYLVGEPDLVGRGLGTRLVAAAVVDAWTAYPLAPCIVVPVAAGNVASWRMLEKVGFGHVGDVDLPPDNPVDPPRHRVLRLSRPGSDGARG